MKKSKWNKEGQLETLVDESGYIRGIIYPEGAGYDLIGPIGTSRTPERWDRRDSNKARLKKLLVKELKDLGYL